MTSELDIRTEARTRRDRLVLQAHGTPNRRGRPARADELRTVVPHLVVYGDFNCPWSYVAARRTSVLEAAGATVDWRAVEHEPWTSDRLSTDARRFAALHHEMDRLLAVLLPNERLPYDLAGFVPRTAAAVAAYAESRSTPASRRVRTVLFEAFWMHGIDIGDARVVRTLLTDDLLGRWSPSPGVCCSTRSADATGGTGSAPAWVARWAADWRDTGKRVVPAVQPVSGAALHGVEAVEWLGRQISERGLDPEPPSGPGAASGADRAAAR